MPKPDAVLDALAAALREAEDAISRARFQVEQARNGSETIIPALVRDLISDSTGWCSHATSWTRTLDTIERMSVATAADNAAHDAFASDMAREYGEHAIGRLDR